MRAGSRGVLHLDTAALQELLKTAANQGASTVSLITPEKVDDGIFKVSAGEKLECYGCVAYQTRQEMNISLNG